MERLEGTKGEIWIEIIWKMIAIRVFRGKVTGFYFSKIKEGMKSDDKCERCDIRGDVIYEEMWTLGSRKEESMEEAVRT